MFSCFLSLSVPQISSRKKERKDEKKKRNKEEEEKEERSSDPKRRTRFRFDREDEMLDLEGKRFLVDREVGRPTSFDHEISRWKRQSVSKGRFQKGREERDERKMMIMTTIVQAEEE